MNMKSFDMLISVVNKRGAVAGGKLSLAHISALMTSKWQQKKCIIYVFYAITLRLEIILIINAVRQCDKTITFHKPQ